MAGQSLNPDSGKDKNQNNSSQRVTPKAQQSGLQTQKEEQDAASALRTAGKAVGLELGEGKENSATPNSEKLSVGKVREFLGEQEQQAEDALKRAGDWLKGSEQNYKTSKDNYNKAGIISSLRGYTKTLKKQIQTDEKILSARQNEVAKRTEGLELGKKLSSTAIKQLEKVVTLRSSDSADPKEISALTEEAFNNIEKATRAFNPDFSGDQREIRNGLRNMNELLRKFTK